MNTFFSSFFILFRIVEEGIWQTNQSNLCWRWKQIGSQLSFLNKAKLKGANVKKNKEHFTVYQSTVPKVALKKGKDACFLIVSKLASHLINLNYT